MTRVLVTGANGFLGSEICAALLAADYQVTAMVRASANIDRLHKVAPAARIAKTETDWRNIESVVIDAEPDIVIHAAAAMDAGDDIEAAENLIAANVLYPSRLIAAAKTAGVKGFITVGTAWQHNQGEGYEPVNLYAASKQAFDDVLRYYAAAGLPCVSLHMFDTYGHLDTRPKLVNLLFKLARTGEAMAMSPGDQEINLVHVSDAAAAFAVMVRRMLEHNVNGFETYAVSGGKPMPLRSLAALAEKISGNDININWGARDYRPREVMHVWRGGAPVPGWSPKISLEEGLKRLWQEHAE